MRIGTLCFVVMLCLSACGGSDGTSRTSDSREDVAAKQMLQGIWLDDATEMAFMGVSGDSVFFAERDRRPMSFRVVHDSIYFIGHDTLAYKIERQSDDDFWYRTFAGDVVKLQKQTSGSLDISDFRSGTTSYEPAAQQRMEKDSIVYYDGTRYRGYVFINPTSIKVLRTTYDENGIGIDNVFYDNVIHICVYEGANRLYGQDIEKSMFSGQFSSDRLSGLVLSDMDFTGVDADGYHYRAVLSVPESPVSFIMNLNISFSGELAITPA